MNRDIIDFKLRIATMLLYDVCHRHGIDVDDMTGRSRAANLIHARREYCFLARACGVGQQISGMVLGRDHSTVFSHLNEGRRAQAVRRDRARRARLRICEQDRIGV